MTKTPVPKGTTTPAVREDLPRRDFLQRSVSIGLGGLALGIAVTPVANASTQPLHLRRGGGLWAGNVQLADFEPLVGEKVSLIAGDGTRVSARLIEASAGNPGRRLPRRPFSLVFDVPGAQQLQDGYYRIAHDAIGALDLFMSPVDLPSRVRRLEAVLG